MTIEIDRPIDPEELRKEWQEKHDPNLEDLPGMRKFIEERIGGDLGDTQSESETFNNFQ